LDAAAIAWLEACKQDAAAYRRQPIAVVSAPMGGGKTISTCLLAKRLQDRDASDVVVWMTMGREWKELPREEFDHASCVILDAADEYLWGHDVPERHRNLVILLQRLAEARIPIILSCRDYREGQAHITRLVRRLVSVIRESVSDDHDDSELVWELARWNDAELRAELSTRLLLQPRATRPAVERQLERLQRGLLDSPLLFGLAFDALAEELETAGGPESRTAETQRFKTPRELTSYWVKRMINRHELQFPAIPDAAAIRLQVAQDVALLATLRGVARLPLDWVRDNAEWAWGRLEALAIRAGWQTPLSRFERCQNELCLTCLLHASAEEPPALSFPHEQILIHLAAQRLDDLLGGNAPRADGPTALNELWQDVGHLLGLGSAQTFNTIAQELRPGAVDIGSLFYQTCAYWASQFWNRRPIERLVDFSAWYAKLPRKVSAEQDRRNLLTIGAANRLVNAMLDQMTHVPNLGQEPMKLDELPGLRGAQVKQGTYLLWGQDGDLIEPHLTPVPHQLERSVFITDLIPNSLYVQFLAEVPSVPLPSQIPGGPRWYRSDRGTPMFWPPERGDDPVVGVTPNEASQFCEWYGRGVANDKGQPFATFLPSSMHLRIAVSGRYLRHRWPDGYYGLPDLAHKQHTRDRGLPPRCAPSSPGSCGGTSGCRVQRTTARFDEGRPGNV
jgi:hypothetical protein